jgi:prephenate dehydrogenase
MALEQVLVVGCGLIGTSIGLALRGSGTRVLLEDRDAAHRTEAVQRGAGEAWDGRRVDLLVVAVPPRATASTLIALQRRDVSRTYTHVSSVQSHVQREIEALSPDPSGVVGGHPLAGREVTGPSAAVQDLFVGRPWAVCAAPSSLAGAVDDVSALAAACGATPVLVDAQAHDEAVALLSHLPQIASSGLAGLLSTAGHALDGANLPLAGPGLADTTRLAAAEPGLWTEILSLNAPYVVPALRRYIASLDELADALSSLEQAEDDAAGNTLAGFLRRGNVGRGRIPVKRGVTSDAFAALRIELEDAPGSLARLMAAIGDRGVNIEDFRIEHVPGRPTGIVELMVASAQLVGLAAELTADGWVVLAA